ncbi:unnamed protein product [Trichobilharzia szidati]|nr:unnamed protein product [Trichobilharzia szidati]
MTRCILLTLICLIIISPSLTLIPKPNKYHLKDKKYCNLLEHVAIEHKYPTCFILMQAVRRFKERLNAKDIPPPDTSYKDTCLINAIEINIAAGCDESESVLRPSHSMDESYKIDLQINTLNITSTEVWGVLHALETVLQNAYNDEWNFKLIKNVYVEDAPRFPHRGLMLDTSKHFLTIGEIHKFIDAMAMVKMNVLHWHITDTESFPYVSSTYPDLSNKGAYHPEAYVYERNEIVDLLEYGRVRGIRIIPEFDTPAHTQSWGNGYPDVLTPCHTQDEEGNQILGPINPTNLTFIHNLYQEILSVFSADNHIHLGGDDVDFTCWQSNPDITNFMQEKQFNTDYSQLENYYMEQLVEIVKSSSLVSGSAMVPIVWQDVYENGFRSDKDMIVQVHKSEGWKKSVEEITGAGFKVLISSCWNFSDVGVGDDWQSFYECDPLNFEGSSEKSTLVVGGEGVIPGDYVDDVNLMLVSWPHAAAIAEQLWSEERTSTSDFGDRLSELRCRMRRLNWNVQPVNGAGFCPI